MRAYNRKKRFGLEQDPQNEMTEVDLSAPQSSAQGTARDGSKNVENLLERLGFGGPNSQKKMGLTILIGLLAGICGVMITLISTNMLSNAKMAAADALLKNGSIAGAFMAWTSISAVLSILSACLVIFFAPSAGGSGVPECKTYLNGALYKGYLESPMFAGIALLAVSLAVASDLPVGHESPLMHISASIACVVCKRWAASEASLPREQRIFMTDRPRIMFITVGVSCGLAAAFRSPLGGVAFAFEEVATHWNFEMCNRCMIGAAVASLLVCYITGSQSILNPESSATSFFDFGMLRLESMGHASAISPTFRIWEMLFIILLGAMGGVTGALFVGITTAMTRLRKRIFDTETSAYRILEVLAITVLASFVWVVLPEFFSCRELRASEIAFNKPNEHVHWKQYTCPDGMVRFLCTPMPPPTVMLQECDGLNSFCAMGCTFLRFLDSASGRQKCHEGYACEGNGVHQ